MDLIELVKEEWPVISQAPLLSAIGLGSAFGIGWLSCHLFGRRELAIAKADRESAVMKNRDLEQVLAQATNGASRIQISITTPRERGAVDQRNLVRGTVEPAGTPIQVMIYSDDNRWHPQQRVEPVGINWVAECYFGRPNMDVGKSFGIVAIDGSFPLSTPVENLPERAAKSWAIYVKRR